jgi:hypothetical protein
MAMTCKWEERRGELDFDFRTKPVKSPTKIMAFIRQTLSLFLSLSLSLSLYLSLSFSLSLSLSHTDASIALSVCLARPSPQHAHLLGGLGVTPDKHLGHQRWA